MSTKISSINCKSQMGDLHSNVQICDQHIIKNGPAGPLMIEYVSLLACSTILEGLIQPPLEISFTNDGAAQLILEKFDNFTPSQLKGSSYPYLQNKQVPTLCLAAGANIKANFIGYKLTGKLTAKIGDKNVKGLFKTHLTSNLFVDPDVENLSNIALIENENSYEVTRFDTDNSFAYLFALRVINKSHISQFYNQLSVEVMFRPLDMNFSPMRLLEPWLSVQGANDISKSIPHLAQKAMIAGYNPETLQLEEGFYDFFSSFDINKVTSVIAKGFEELQSITPQNTLKKVFDSKKVKALIKEGLLDIELLERSFEQDYIHWPDIKNHKVVQQYCTASIDKNAHVLDGVSYIAQCMTSIRYVQMLGTAVCYLGLKHKYDPSFRPEDTIKAFSQPDIIDCKCHRLPFLHNNVCNLDIFEIDKEMITCVSDLETNIPVCDLLGEHLDVCKPTHVEL